MPEVSVIIPNYNHAPYLKQRIDSVLAQTFQDIEIIILDDCSKDNSREIIKEYQHDTRVQSAFNKSNSGCVFKQWNKGLKMATGKYVWIAESDDYSAPTFLETLVDRLEADPAVGLAFCDSFRVCNGEVNAARDRWFGEFAHLYERDFKADGREYVARQMLFINTIPNTSSVVFRRSLAEQIGGADETFLLSGDWLFWIKLLERCNLAYISTPLNYYRYHEQTARHANLTNGVMIEDACRISLYVLKSFPVSPEDAKTIRERLTGWFVETMNSGHAAIPSPRRRSIRRLACELNPNAVWRLWFRRSGLQWFWLGCRRRALTILDKRPVQNVDRSIMRVLLITTEPPRNDCGVRVVLHRHLVERNPFKLHVVSNADFADGLLVHTPIRLPYPIHRLRKSRFGPRLAPWITDYENLVWPLAKNPALEEAVQRFQPDALLTLAETGLCRLALETAKRHRLPLVGLFLDWFPVMKHHYGHRWTQGILTRRYRELYAACDLAFCTSDGMKEVLGPHPNCHVIYPMPGQHRVPEKTAPQMNGKFRLVYVGSVENFYGRMICRLIEKIEATNDLEIIVVGPNADWPPEILARAKSKGIYLGFKPPEEAAKILARADALLVVMSFEPEHRLFMETSFTTKFLDYVAFSKSVILWAPEYCTPVRVARRDGGAVVVNTSEADRIVSVCREIAGDPALREKLSKQAQILHQGLFNPDRLQEIFVREIEKLAVCSK